MGSERWPSRILSSNWGGFAERATKSAVRSITAVEPFHELGVDYIYDYSHLISGGGRISPLANLKALSLIAKSMSTSSSSFTCPLVAGTIIGSTIALIGKADRT